MSWCSVPDCGRLAVFRLLETRRGEPVCGTHMSAETMARQQAALAARERRVGRKPAEVVAAS